MLELLRRPVSAAEKEKEWNSMEICLGTRTEETVRIYFERAQDPFIKAVLPQKAQTVEEALRDYEESLRPGASSFGRTILADGVYIGDIWCYGMDPEEEPNAMLSCCIFEERFRNHGIAAEAAKLFLREIRERFGLKTLGAFVYSENAASIRLLEKLGFRLEEEFVEDGRASKYFRYAPPGETGLSEKSENG